MPENVTCHVPPSAHSHKASSERLTYARRACRVAPCVALARSGHNDTVSMYTICVVVPSEALFVNVYQ
jgi:hypothetical protein